MQSCTFASLIRRSVLLSLAVAPIVSAQQFTLQHTNSINLGTQFFGPDIPNGLPGSGYGSNPISVAYDGTNVYVGGQNNSGVSDFSGIVRVNNVFATTPATFTPLTGTQLPASSFTGINGLTADASGVYSITEGSGVGTLIRKSDSSGNLIWSKNANDIVSGYLPSAIAIDPKVNNGNPGVALIGIGSGRRTALTTDAGTVLFGPSGFAGPQGGIINSEPSSTIGSTYRGMSFDSAGNILALGNRGIGYGTRDTTVAGPNQYNLFRSLTNQADRTTAILTKEEKTFAAQGVQFLEGTGPNALMAFNARPGADITTAMNVTDLSGNVTSVNTRGVQIRTLTGAVASGIQSVLLGDEDGIGGAFSGVGKGLAIGKDADNNPVLFVVSLEERKLDVYSLEPTWTTTSGDWSTPANWLAGLVPNSGLQNARFGAGIASTGGTVTLNDNRTTKNLKLDSAGSFLFIGGGTLTLDGPGDWGSQIQVVSGSHSIGVPVTLSKSVNVNVANASDTLTITGDISAAGKGVTKRGAGTAVVKNLRLSALALRGGTLSIASNGSASGTSKTGSLVIEGVTDAWTSTLDLANNAIAVDYTATSPIAEIQNQIKSGYAAGAWTGTGIRSSAAASSAPPTKGAIAYAENSELSATPALFNQVTVDADTVLVMYTLAGDATMDRKVDTVDFNMLAGNFGTGSKWVQGDSNYDGAVDSLDFGLLVGNFGASLPASAPTLGSVVPEPASLGVIAFGLAATFKRRRK